MKMLNSFAKMMALTLASALVATALPSNTDSVQLMSPRGTGELEGSNGISCGGNFGCEGGYCPPNSTMIKNMIAKIDDKSVFKNFDKIACARCATEAERPADYKQGICLFAKATVTGKVVKASVNAIIKNGCERCGSDEDVQINFTRDACETGLCPGIKQASAVASRDGESAPSVEDKPVAVVPGTSLPSDAPYSPDDALLGINCRGSTMCNRLCLNDGMENLKKYIEQMNRDHHNNYTNGQQIVCENCKLSNTGQSALCVYPQRLPAGQDMDYDQIQSKFKAIWDHGCRQCGSCPVYPGNNVGTGELTVNFVYHGCGSGICEH